MTLSALREGTLGVAERADQLVPGDPEEVRRCADRVDGMCDYLADVVWEVDRAVADAECWTGRGARAFWDDLGDVGERVQDGLDALAPVADALRQYAAVLDQAQSEASSLMVRWEAAAEAAEAEQSAGLPTAPATYSEPGYGDRLSWAQRRLVQDLRILRSDVASVADRVEDVLAESLVHTPRATGAWNQIGYHASQFGHGIVDAVTDAASMVWDYGLRWTFDPVGGAAARWGLVSSLVEAAFTDPLQFGKDLVDWDTWVSNPARAAGRLVPDVAAGAATGGVGTSVLRGRKAARVASVTTPQVSVSRALHESVSGFWAGRGVRGPLGEFDPASVFPHAGSGVLDVNRAERWLDLGARWDGQGRHGLSAMAHGNVFNQLRAGVYAYDEVPLRLADGRLARLDSWTPDAEVVSRKATQLSEVSERTAMRYLTEFKEKYWPRDDRIVVADTVGARRMFADSPDLIGDSLSGSPVLEVPVQRGEVPLVVREYAAAEGIEIRDVTGHVYNQDEMAKLRAGILP